MKALFIIGLIVAVSVLIDLVVVAMAKILPMRVKSDLKFLRYESGCMPIENPKFVLPFQYIPFVIVFLALEPIIVLILLLSTFSDVLTFLAVTLALVIPSVVCAYRFGGLSDVPRPR
jgi:NADH-quinone oxidoreductase subunit A